jgi:flagellar biosynthesis protein FliQ
MQPDTSVLIASIVCLVVLAIVSAVFNISPDKLVIISRVIDVLCVILGASGFARLTRAVGERKEKK